MQDQDPHPTTSFICTLESMTATQAEMLNRPEIILAQDCDGTEGLCLQVDLPDSPVS